MATTTTIYTTKMQSAHEPHPPPSLPHHHPSTSLSSFLACCIPFLELFRLNKPIGILYLYFPCLIGTLAVTTLSITSPSHLSQVNLLLFLSSAALRSAGCSWNDTLDQELDRKVARTRSRPLARGAINSSAAHLCTGVMVLLFFALQQRLPVLGRSTMILTPCVWYGVPFVVATGMYPLMKRITYYPQAFLGIPSSWGLVVAFPALGIDLFGSRRCMALLCSLCVSNIAWTILYDMIYGFQDVQDDLKTGIKSIAVRHQKHPKLVLSLLGVVQIAFLGVAAWILNAGLACYCCIACTTALVGMMVTRVDLASPASCAWWFKYGCLLVGGCTVCGFFVEYARSQSWI